MVHARADEKDPPRCRREERHGLEEVVEDAADGRRDREDAEVQHVRLRAASTGPGERIHQVRTKAEKCRGASWRGSGPD